MNRYEAICRMRDVVRRQHKALATEQTYIQWLQRYMAAVSQMPACLTSEQKLEQFLTQLAVKYSVSASTQNQAFNAILFFYNEVLRTPLQNVNALRANRPAHMRHAPSVGQTRDLLSKVRNWAGYPTRLITGLLYGGGLRVSEPLNLRIKDVDMEKAVLFIRGAKGGKDRVVSMPRSLTAEMQQQRACARKVWQEDQQKGIPVELPFQLARKYPGYQFDWSWAWFFSGAWALPSSAYRTDRALSDA